MAFHLVQVYICRIVSYKIVWDKLSRLSREQCVVPVEPSKSLRLNAFQRSLKHHIQIPNGQAMLDLPRRCVYRFDCREILY